MAKQGLWRNISFLNCNFECAFVCDYLLFLVVEAKGTMADDVEVINVGLINLQNAVHAISSIYLPVILAAVEEATNAIETIDTEELNASLACIRQLYAMVSLIATCAQSILPRAPTELVLYPDFVCSYFPGRDFCSELERSKHLFFG